MGGDTDHTNRDEESVAVDTIEGDKPVDAVKAMEPLAWRQAGPVEAGMLRNLTERLRLISLGGNCQELEGFVQRTGKKCRLSHMVLLLSPHSPISCLPTVQRTHKADETTPASPWARQISSGAASAF